MSIDIKLGGAWAKLEAILKDGDRRLAAAAQKAVLQEAHAIRGKVIENINSGGTLAGKPFAPLSPMTLIVRRFRGFNGTKPLIVSGALVGSVTVQKVAGGVLVGVNRKSAGGVNLAKLHEEGGGPWTRPMTDRQRRFLAAALRSAGQRMGDVPGGGGVLKIRIPARPYFQPVIDRFAQSEDVRRRFWEVIAKETKGDFGRP